MKGKDSGEAKGYAFVTFRNKELASKAIEELNNSELKVSSTNFGHLSFPIIATVNYQLRVVVLQIYTSTFIRAFPFEIYYLNPFYEN